MGLQLVSVGVTFPVEIHLDRDLGHPGYELLMLLDEGSQKVVLLLLLGLCSLRHEDLAHLGQPLFHLDLLQVLAEGLPRNTFTRLD